MEEPAWVLGGGHCVKSYGRGHKRRRFLGLGRYEREKIVVFY